MRLVVALVMTVLVACASPRPAGEPPTDNAPLRALYEQDQADRRLGHGADWTAISRRDAERRREVRALLDAGSVRTAADHYHAAMVFQHGGDSTSFRTARDLARRADRMGHERARWLAAAAHDRHLLSVGERQDYGTQYEEHLDGTWYLSPIDTTSVSDAERRRVGARTLDEIRAFLAEKNGTPTGSLETPPPFDAHHGDMTVELIGGLDALAARVEVPEAAQAAGIEGSVRVQVVVAEDGSVEEAFVVDGLAPDVDAAVLRAVREAQFVNHTGGAWEIRLAVPVRP